MRYVGLDIGSTSIKGALLDVERVLVGEPVRVASPEPRPGPPGHYEVDPRAILECVEQVLERLLAQGHACQGIVFCSQMAGVVLVDRNHTPLSNYLSWRDQRSSERHPSEAGSYRDVLHRRLTRTEVRQLGNELTPGSAPSLLFWLAEQGQLPPGAVPVALGDFVTSHLCGAEPRAQSTNAGGALNLESGDWHRTVFEKLGLDRLSWPRLSEPTEPLGWVARGGTRLPCYPAIGDHQCALAGTLLEPGELSLNISTGSQASLLSEQLQLGTHQTRPYFDGRFLNTITHLPAGRSLNVLVNLLTELVRMQGLSLHDPWPDIARAAAAAPDTELATDLAFFAGPLGDRGNIANITVDNLTVGTLFRAAFRAMAQNYRHCAEALAPQGDWHRVVFSGGLAQRLTLLREFVLDQLRCPYRVCGSEEDTLEGLLIFGLVVSGRAANFAAATELVRLRVQNESSRSHEFSG